MKAVILAESKKGEEFYFTLTEEMFDAEPSLAFKLGQLMGLCINHDGKVTYL